jgi:hypothetical protein
MELNPADHEKIKYLFETTPFDKDDIQKVYDKFGFYLSDRFLYLIIGLGISVDLALSEIELYLETVGGDKTWHLRPNKLTYFNAFETFLSEKFGLKD